MATNTEKERFSARVQSGTLDTMDEFAEGENLNRSQAIDRIVAEWESGKHSTPDTRPLINRGRLAVELALILVGFGLSTWVFIAEGMLDASLVTFSALGIILLLASTAGLYGLLLGALARLLCDVDADKDDLGRIDRWLALVS